MNFLKGKKTYIIVILGVLTILTQFISGDVTFAQFLASVSVVQLIELLGIGAVRKGVSG